jgi:hypothetical protein
LASAIESAYGTAPLVHRDRIEINATVPAVPAAQVPEVLARFSGARTVKVKVAEPGQTLVDDVAQVNAARAVIPTVRVDANGGWTLAEAVAAARALTADGPLEYLEQPCATVDELAELRRRVDIPVAADESIRKADDPLRVVRAGRRRRGAQGCSAGRRLRAAGHRGEDRRPGGGVERAGHRGRNRCRADGRRRPARVAACLRAGNRQPVRRGWAEPLVAEDGYLPVGR